MSKRLFRIRTLAAIALILSAGCASLAGMQRMDDFTETAKAYEKSLYWSKFESAAAFLDPEIAVTPPDFEALNRIKVTAYDRKRLITSKDHSEVRQSVEISYFRQNDPVIKTIRDEQLWVYNEDSGQWYIQSGLPKFK
jgi:hypothetical protein